MGERRGTYVAVNLSVCRPRYRKPDFLAGTRGDSLCRAASGEAVAKGEHDRAILCCGSGLGMNITDNKVPGVRAAQCHDVSSAERARKYKSAQVVTMGQRVTGPELAKTVLPAWLQSEFAGGSSTRKVEEMGEIDRRYHQAETI